MVHVKGEVSMKSRRRHMIPYLLVLPSLVVMALVLLYPFAKTIEYSLRDYALFRQDRPYVGLRNFVEVVQADTFWPVFKNTLCWSLGSMGLQLVLGLSVALLLNRPIPGVRIVRSLILLPWVMPGAVLGTIWPMLLSPLFGPVNDALLRLGLIDQPITFLGGIKTAMPAVIAANVWSGFPFWVLMLTAGLQNIPDELYEAAAIDGAGRWKQFRYITLPHLSLILNVTAVLSFIWSFNNLTLIFVMTKGGPLHFTRTFPIQIYLSAFRNHQFGEASALAVITFLFIAVAVFTYMWFARREDS